MRNKKQFVTSFDDARDLTGNEHTIYTFCGEWGRKDLTYLEYLNNKQIFTALNDNTRYKLCVGRTIFSYESNFLKSRPEIISQLKTLENAQKLNPLRFFAPSGNDALEFLNNTDDDILILTACNRFGKTQTGMIKVLLNSVPCDKSWEIFSKYKVKHIPYIRPVTVGIASYELSSHMATLLPMLLNWAPVNELGKYAKSYKGKGAKQVTLRVDPRLTMECGSEFKFFACSQGQAPFESDVREFWLWDEQGEETKFDGADERARTTPTGGKHYMPMTPHKVEGRPDTGGGSWISKLWNSKEAKGRTIKKYKGSVWVVPDWIYPESSKEKAYKKWIVEPTIQQNDKVLREGKSRFLGEWHESSGLVIDEWNREKHVIEPFDIPNNWTRYRSIDHGSSSHPTACIWAAMSPAGDLFIYKDYLKIGDVISQSCKNIVELSGNKLIANGRYENPSNGIIMNRYTEDQSNVQYQYTTFDGRAFSQTDSGNTGLKLSDLYRMAGIQLLKGAGQKSEIYVPIIKEWFVIDNDKKHFVTKENGAPRTYVFSTCKNFISQIQGWVWEERKRASSSNLSNALSPRKKDDDLMDCMKILIQSNPRFRGSITLADKNMYKFLHDYDEDENKLITGGVTDSICGY